MKIIQVQTYMLATITTTYFLVAIMFTQQYLYNITNKNNKKALYLQHQTMTKYTETWQC